MSVKNSNVTIELLLLLLLLFLLAQYCSGDQIETNEVGGACSTYGERRGIYRVYVWKSEVKRPLGRPKFRWGDIIKVDLQEVGCRDMDWIELERGRALVNAVMNLRGSVKSKEFLTS
jgi:hypothetical protein